jgi:hypothetical protein
MPKTARHKVFRAQSCAYQLSKPGVRAVPEIAGNLEKLLLRTRRPVKLVDHTLEIFGDFYGQVTEPAVRKAVQRLHEQGKTPSDGVGVKRTREITVHPGSLAA